MKNNQGIVLSKDFINNHKLSTSPPPQDSLFWKMWNSCQDIANEALNTAFIQGIKNANLDPVKYGGFNVSDAYYCFHGASDYLTAANKASDQVLRAFLMKKYVSYDKYNQTFPHIWHVQDANGIVPSEVCKEYSAYESKIIAENEAIYALVVMLPCEYLWAWLGGQLSPPVSGNLYAPWITGNDDPTGAYAMGNFIDLYQKNYPIDEDFATQIYTQAMTYEFENFKTATD